MVVLERIIAFVSENLTAVSAVGAALYYILSRVLKADKISSVEKQIAGIIALAIKVLALLQKAVEVLAKVVDAILPDRHPK